MKLREEARMQKREQEARVGRGSDATGGLGHVRPHTAILFYVRCVLRAMGSLRAGAVAGAHDVIAGCFVGNELQGQWMKQGVLNSNWARQQS